MQYFQMVVRLQGDMEDEAGALSAGVSPDEIKGAVDSIARLTDIPFPTDFSAKIPALSLVDATLRQVVFNWKAAKATLDFTHLAPMILAFIALLLGSWDLGSGELSGGGDYNRGGIFGSESGFLRVSGGALILSFLSLFLSIAAYVLLISIFPLMRENLLYLIFGVLAVEYGHIASHASDPYFPIGSEPSAWVGLLVSNFIMLFIALGVVRRSVMETRDFHVEVMHMHPDPRKMRSAKEDHSLLLWNVSLVLWLVFLNLSSWAGSHSIARPPPIGADLGGLVFLHIASGAMAFFFLMHLSWYPQFMMGDSSGGIQSRLSRLLSEGQDSTERVHEVGKCPDCGVSSAASMDENGNITVLCTKKDCGGRGEAGAECPECLGTLDDHLSCGSCGARTHVRAHFSSQGELW